jgi:hypothetical protein
MKEKKRIKIFIDKYSRKEKPIKLNNKEERRIKVK